MHLINVLVHEGVGETLMSVLTQVWLNLENFLAWIKNSQTVGSKQLLLVISKFDFSTQTLLGVHSNIFQMLNQTDNSAIFT